MDRFDKYGFLYPSTNISSTKEELVSLFCFNDHRRNLFSGFERYSKDLQAIIGREIRQWVNGSFTTRKLNPGDIDIVSFINFEDFDRHQKELKRFVYPESKRNYSVDAYIVIAYPDLHNKKFYYDSDLAYWHSIFSREYSTGRKKGFLDINNSL